MLIRGNSRFCHSFDSANSRVVKNLQIELIGYGSLSLQRIDCILSVHIFGQLPQNEPIAEVTLLDESFYPQCLTLGIQIFLYP